MRWLLFWSMTILTSALTTRAAPQPISEPVAFVGELRSVILTRPDLERMRAPDDEGGLVVSNACGEQTATFRVVRSTAPVSSPQSLAFVIGEWCDPPVEFPHDHWLVVTGGPRGEPAAFPVFATGGAVFALVNDEAAYRRGLSEAMQRRLPLESLPAPVEFPLGVDLTNRAQRQFIASQSTLEIRGESVWVVRAILLTSVFPGLSPDEFHAPVQDLPASAPEQ
jgi:hypothetical protein